MREPLLVPARKERPYDSWWIRDIFPMHPRRSTRYPIALQLRIVPGCLLLETTGFQRSVMESPCGDDIPRQVSESCPFSEKRRMLARLNRWRHQHARLFPQEVGAIDGAEGKLGIVSVPDDCKAFPVRERLERVVGLEHGIVL